MSSAAAWTAPVAPTMATPPIAPPGPTFFKIDHRRFAVREYRRWTKSPLTIVISKWLGAPVRTSSDDPAVAMLAPFEVDAAAVPEAVRAKLHAYVDPLAAAGFHSPVFHAVDDVLHSTVINAATFVDPSGRSLGQVHNRVWSVRNPPKDVTFPIFISATQDGRFVVTSGGPQDLDAPPAVDALHVPGASLEVLRATHERRLAEPGRPPVLAVRSATDARALLERHHGVIRDFHLRRGVFRAWNDDDRRRAAVLSEHRQRAAAGGLQHAEVLAEIELLQNKKASWVTAVLMLGVSLALFVGQGWVSKTQGLSDSWPTLALLVGVLFVHELGHYVAMQAFGYKNVRMFFIPGLGAAVSGRHYNVAGWRKAIVSLMGPVPGVVLGVGVGIAAMATHHPMLFKASLMLVGLNALNLLPVLPLDGGWVMHTLLFSRHYLADALFRAAAGVAVILISLLWLHEKFLMYVGLFLLLNLPLAFKLARLAAQVRREGVSPVSPDDQSIPTDTAQRIIGRVKEAFPRAATNRMLAQHTLQVFETINARPPGVGATIVLGIVHWGTLAFAVVFGAMMVVSMRGGLSLPGLAGRPLSPPKYALDLASVRAPQFPPAAVRPATTQRSIVGTLTGDAAASEIYSAAREDKLRAATVGRTVVVDLAGDDDVARKRWVANLKERGAKGVFVTAASGPFAFSGGLTLTFTADQRSASRIESDLKDYFGCIHFVHAIPPWHPTFGRMPADQLVQVRLARHTFTVLMRAGGEAYKDAKVKDFGRQIDRASREGDLAELKRVERQRQEAIAALRAREVERIAHDTSGAVDVELARQFASVPRPGDFFSSDDADDDGPDGGQVDWQAEIAKRCGPRLGQLPLDGTKPTAGADAYSAVAGNVLHPGKQLRLNWLTFEDPAFGAPATIKWLAAQGCSDFRYEFQAPYVEGD